MSDRRDRPLRSEELERDRAEAGTDTSLAGAEENGRTGPASEDGDTDFDGSDPQGPDPIAGTMLPPD